MSFSKSFFMSLILLTAFLHPVLAMDELLWVSNYTGDLQNWDDRNEPHPYLSDEDTGYIHEEKTKGATEGYYEFLDLDGTGNINNVTLYVECYGDDSDDIIEVYIDCVDGFGWVLEGSITVNQPSYYWESLNLTARLDSAGDVRNTQMYFSYRGILGGDDVYVRRAYLLVEYDLESSPSEESNPGDGDTIIMGAAGVFWICGIILIPIVAYVLKQG